MASEASGLESLAKGRMSRDRELRAMAPPMDWEAIATEGAEKLAVQWNSTEGKPQVPLSTQSLYLLNDEPEGA